MKQRREPDNGTWIGIGIFVGVLTGLAGVLPGSFGIDLHLTR